MGGSACEGCTQGFSSARFNLGPLPNGSGLPRSIPCLTSSAMFGFVVPQRAKICVLRVMPSARATHASSGFLMSAHFGILALSLNSGHVRITALSTHDKRPVTNTGIDFCSSCSRGGEGTVTRMLASTKKGTMLP